MPVQRESFGQLDNGEPVEKFTLTNSNGVIVELIDYGATITSVKLPNKDGTKTDIVLGFDNIYGYLGKNGRNPYMGAIVGRVANRIAKGSFELDGKKYSLAQNNGENSLHGGLQGFDKVVWNAYVNPGDEDSVSFAYLSKDGEEGYPGNVCVNVSYKLREDNGLDISIVGLTDQPTLLNLANHAYFNLVGHESGAQGLYEHSVMIQSDSYLPTNDKQIPLGHLAPVDGSVFDLRSAKMMAEQLPLCPGGAHNGYDHNFCINGNQNEFRLAAWIEHGKSGRSLECYSNQPGMQFYSGNFLPADGSLKGKLGTVYEKHGGFCCETQMFPDAINQKNFDHDSILRPGQKYEHRVMYKFGF